ncbi:hypothetical protein TQ38_020155 [Novosphingobium sp. P6W]|nr:hypothetical protein TQ38_020155 [Novosphingobium sp. P6W]
MKQTDLPVSRPTSCCLSPDRRVLYVTTARLGLTDAKLEQEPLAGALLRIRLDAVRSARPHYPVNGKRRHSLSITSVRSPSPPGPGRSFMPARVGWLRETGP